MKIYDTITNKASNNRTYSLSPLRPDIVACIYIFSSDALYLREVALEPLVAPIPGLP